MSGVLAVAGSNLKRAKASGNTMPIRLPIITTSIMVSETTNAISNPQPAKQKCAGNNRRQSSCQSNAQKVVMTDLDVVGLKGRHPQHPGQ